MSELLTVYTSFADISELSSGFADRVEENQIILYGPTAYAEGDEIAFRVLLADESAGLEGTGFVTAVYDGGEERDPEIRYDVVIAGLRLEGLSEVVFERLLVARQSLVSDEPPSTRMPAISEEDASGFDDQDATAVASLADILGDAELAAPAAEEVVEEVITAEVAIVELPATGPVVAAPEPAFEPEPEPEPVVAAPEPEPEPLFPERPRVEEPKRAPREAFEAVEVAPIAGGGRNAGAAGEGFRGLPPPAAPPVPPGFSVQKGLLGDQLGRPVLGSTWQPEPRAREVAAASDGLFDYGGPIRLPQNPPRPEGLSGHVTRAPAATTEAAYRASREAAGHALPRPATQAVASAVDHAADATDDELVDDLDVVGH